MASLMEMGSNLSIKVEFGSISKTIYIVMNRWTESYITREKNRLIHGIKIRKLKIITL
jgi:hypothetical protein